MPIYEYRCEGCRRRVSVWVRRMGQEAECCPACGGKRLTRLVSRFALGKSEEGRMEKLADEAALAGVDESDPKSMARLLRRMGQELGEGDSAEIEQAVEEMERGGTEEGGDSGANGSSAEVA